MEYTAWNNDLVVRTGKHNSVGWPVSVDMWVGNTYSTVYEETVCADSFRETIETALTAAGFDWEVAVDLCDGWNLEYPNNEEDQ